MQRTTEQLWQRFQQYYTEFPEIGLAIDLSRVNFPDDFFQTMAAPMEKAFAFMDELEKGAIANRDENRRVGHYWLRNPSLAPEAIISQDIALTLQKIKQFVADVHAGGIRGKGGNFKNLLVIGIGGSALGPQFVSHALGQPTTDKMKPYFFDNTDPDGMDKVLVCIGKELNQTLCVVISKSGETKETRNGMLEAEAAYVRVDLKFGKHAVAITQEGSKLDKLAEGWLNRFPMWDWVGGRTSETSAVGLVPAALQGINIDELLLGAKTCDEVTRRRDVWQNPAAQLALMWHFIGKGHGEKDMVILPYKDRLELFSKYLQQLVMESLGKEKDLDGKKVCQGLSVFGNKGSTDQHAYVQQLRDGLNNFFVVFIQVLKDRHNAAQELMVEEDVTSGDYLDGFLLGTRKALYENGRESITITIKEVSPFAVGVLIALFERTVGLYAHLININAYHQPGVQAGKVAAASVIESQRQILKLLRTQKGSALTASQIAEAIGTDDIETVFKVCEHLAANERGLKKLKGQTPVEVSYAML